MSELIISKAQLELIEKMGVANEMAGMQPVASRILALLIISDKTELTFDEIKQTLGISKSSASVAINFLLGMKKIAYITKVGDRKRYFRSNIINWKEDMKQKMGQMMEINTLLKEVLKQRTRSTREFNNTLAEMIDFMEFFQKEVPGIFKKWESSNK